VKTMIILWPNCCYLEKMAFKELTVWPMITVLLYTEHVAAVELMLLYKQVVQFLSQVDDRGYTPLNWACYNEAPKNNQITTDARTRGTQYQLLTIRKTLHYIMLV